MMFTLTEMKKTASCLWFIAVFLFITSCQTKPAATATGTQAQETLGPERVDIRGYITSRDYAEGQAVLFVEGVGDPTSRFDRALILVTPMTRIMWSDGRSMSLHELQMGQHVAVQFRGRYRESITGARATAREMWVEPYFQ